jgi:hypothetical protein
MCLAIYKPAITIPDEEAYLNGFQSNNHGAGFAAAADGGLVIAKGFFKFKDFWSAFEPYHKCPAIVHFRLATHGHRDEENCHPFSVSDDLAMIHNGILSIDTEQEPTKSDTWHYVESVLKPIHAQMPEFYADPSLRFMGEQAIEGSKFIFLRADGDCAIWNEEDGHWTKDGHWYSNGGYKRYSFSGFRYERALPFRDVDWPNDGDLVEDFSEARAWPDYVIPHMADKLLEYGFGATEIEEGFLRDPREMRNLYAECVDSEL